jgi:hypothetical protein
VHVHWKHVSLAAQAGLLDFSLCLRPAAHREPHDVRQPGALPTGRQDSKPQDTRCTGALPAGLEPFLSGGGIQSRWTHGAPEPSQRVRSHGTHGCAEALLIMEAGFRAAGHVVHQSPPSGSRAMVHVAATEPFLSRRQDPEPLNTWQLRSPP